MSSRTQNTIKNILWGNVSQIIGLIVKFISRTYFIHYLGQSYMGVSGLFANVLGVLSFSELGIGTAINFALYKPVAEKNTEKIKSLIALYKKAYRIIALVVFVIGIGLMPFLKFLIKDPGDIGNVNLYYLIFLFDTATGYLVTYKYALLSAEQKNYILTNITTVVTIITAIIQIAGMILYRSYLLYLLISLAVNLGTKVFNALYLDKRYPYLKQEAQPLDDSEYQAIKKNVGALIVHKIGDVCVHQTDNILISALISIEVTGRISNYNYVITTVTGFLSIIFGSVVASLGNLVALENKEKQYEIFRIYRFVGFWLYGFCAIAYFTLFQPFISIWAGAEWLVDDLTVALICLERYNIGHRVVVNNFKSAAGVFQQDKWVAFGQAAINLIVSIVMVKLIGLPGIYVGTVVQGLLATAVKPVILYRDVFEKPWAEYYIDSIKYLLVELLAAAVLFAIKSFIIPNATIFPIGRFVGMVMITAIVPNLIFAAVFHRRDEFKYLKNMVNRKIMRKGDRL